MRPGRRDRPIELLRMSDPSHFRSKPFYVVLLFLQHILRYEQRESTISDADTFYPRIEPSLYFFPYEVRCRLEQVSET